ncbi:sigma factor-like helix-turn-helix DNA-binding protein [Streptomyces sp. B-S-A8]|uniref:Sigma factor-like helix-turn-helix DNA-binding protein n=1 Tax=Streptomyces solicavernae TaxID=3043614 RepID=A0ABT6S1K5_9ACTN|nr:sigma factor-like helix-turn-helix DNA-binding protein [Streptomyces sp. B-S-A8]MDI3390562.1 sigma factor-like helix-turn-helix DNA-binding protein [Streptomyces sp. B-S-A8]
MTGAEDTEGQRTVQGLETLERLSPLERAVFVLRDVFVCGIPQIAVAVGCSEAACRQLAGTVPGAGDGAGAPPRTWPRNIVGAENVARVLSATIPPLVRIGITLNYQWVDGRPGVVLRGRDGGILSALALDIVDGRIQTLHVVLGSKLTH